MLCPICKKPVEEPNERATAKGQRSYFPFCSERCKVIDLGDWAAEKFRIEVEPPDPGEGDPPP